MAVITAVYNLLWGDLITIPLPGGGSIGFSLLVLLLIPAGGISAFAPNSFPFVISEKCCTFLLNAGLKPIHLPFPDSSP